MISLANWNLGIISALYICGWLLYARLQYWKFCPARPIRYFPLLLQKGNKQVTTVSRDRAAAYAKAVEEILPECIQIADRFHLHQNLMEAVKKVLKSEIPSVITILADEKPEASDTQAAEPEQS